MGRPRLFRSIERAAIFAPAVGLGLFLSFAGFTSAAAEQEPSAAVHPALSVLDRMTESLRDAGAFRVSADVAFDVTQDDGRVLEFGGTRRIVMRRPDMLLAEIQPRTGTARRVRFDGDGFTVYIPSENVYGEVPVVGDLDTAVGYVSGRLGFPVPLVDLLRSDLGAGLAQEATEPLYVGEATVDGVVSDHVSFRAEGLEWQLWVAREGARVPVRIVITYAAAEGRPRFRAALEGWELDPVLTDADFDLRMPEDAEKVPFVPQRRTPEVPSSGGDNGAAQGASR